MVGNQLNGRVSTNGNRGRAGRPAQRGTIGEKGKRQRTKQLERSTLEGDRESTLNWLSPDARNWLRFLARSQNKQWLREYNAIQGELPISFAPRSRLIADVPPIDVTSPDDVQHLRLLDASQAHDLREAEYAAASERRWAVDGDKHRKAVQILQERIEALYQKAFNETAG